MCNLSLNRVDNGGPVAAQESSERQNGEISVVVTVRKTIITIGVQVKKFYWVPCS